MTSQHNKTFKLLKRGHATNDCLIFYQLFDLEDGFQTKIATKVQKLQCILDAHVFGGGVLMYEKGLVICIY